MDNEITDTGLMSRRRALQAAGGLLSISMMPWTVSATPDTMAQEIRSMFGDLPMTPQRVSMKLPPLSENGYSVPLTVEVDSPMNADDYVRRLAIFSERNPLPLIAVYHFTPMSGRARVENRIRLGGSQTITAIAEMNDGRLFVGTGKTIVTVAACVIL